MRRPRAIRKTLFRSLTFALLLLPMALRAGLEAERGWEELDKGRSTRALQHFEKALKDEPCDKWTLIGFEKAGGDITPFKKLCLTPEPTPLPVVTDIPAPKADAEPGPQAQPMAQAKEGPTPVVPEQPLKVVQPEGKPIIFGFSAKDILRWALVMALLALLSGVGIFLLAISLDRSKAKPTGEGDAAAAEGGEAVAVAEAVAPAAVAVPSPASIVAALPPTSAEPVLSKGTAPLDASARVEGPFGPGESVRISISAGAEQAFLTEKKFYWNGRRKLDGYGRGEAPITVAVPFEQVTGVAWAKPQGGDLLIIGTAMAGDIGLEASRYGTAALQGFAQALSQALDQIKG